MFYDARWLTQKKPQWNIPTWIIIEVSNVSSDYGRAHMAPPKKKQLIPSANTSLNHSSVDPGHTIIWFCGYMAILTWPVPKFRLFFFCLKDKIIIGAEPGVLPTLDHHTSKLWWSSITLAFNYNPALSPLGRISVTWVHESMATLMLYQKSEQDTNCVPKQCNLLIEFQTQKK